MIEPKEKAKEIFFKMYKVENSKKEQPNCYYTAKNSSFVAVNEILNAQQGEMVNYWEKVKEELKTI